MSHFFHFNHFKKYKGSGALTREVVIIFNLVVSASQNLQNVALAQGYMNAFVQVKKWYLQPSLSAAFMEHSAHGKSASRCLQCCS